MKVLLVDDTKTERLILTAYLEKLDHEVIHAENGNQAIALVKSESPELVLLDVIMPEMDGHEAARIIRQDESEWVPIIFLSGRVATEDIVAGIEAGGDDYLTKPVDYRILEAKMTAMQRIAKMRRKLLDVTDELNKLVNKDGMTGLANRRYLDEYLAMEVARSIRNKAEIAVILIDIDFFKKYNDTKGHLEGDDCLKTVASELKKACKRAPDLVARYGGEEFCAVLPETQMIKAVKVAEEMRKSVESLQISHPASDLGVVTISVGVCGGVPKSAKDIEVMLKCADDALYQAKESGRNQVRLYEET